MKHIRTFTSRCKRHEQLILEGKLCVLCAKEQANPDAVFSPLRGERLEDHEGKPVKEK